MKIIAAIPAYNEEIAIGSVVLKTMPYVDEIFVVDDGSHDATAEIAKAAGANVVQHKHNGGYGEALKTCFKVGKESDADLMFILDADGQHNPDDIAKMAEPIKNDQADIVIGSRFLEGSKGEIPLYRRFGMKIIDSLANSGLDEDVSDSQSGFRAYSKRAINSIEISEIGMGAGAEILIDAISKKLRIAKVPISVRYDVGVPSQHPVVQGFSVVTALIRLIAERHALLFFGVFGIGLLVFGLYEGVTVVSIYNSKQVLATGTALVSVMFTLIGTYMMFTGVILYVVKDMVEGRFKYEY